MLLFVALEGAVELKAFGKRERKVQKEAQHAQAIKRLKVLFNRTNTNTHTHTTSANDREDVL